MGLGVGRRNRLAMRELAGKLERKKKNLRKKEEKSVREKEKELFV